jgi:hypothetical protein
MEVSTVGAYIDHVEKSCNSAEIKKTGQVALSLRDQWQIALGI